MDGNNTKPAPLISESALVALQGQRLEIEDLIYQDVTAGYISLDHWIAACGTEQWALQIVAEMLYAAGFVRECMEFVRHSGSTIELHETICAAENTDASIQLDLAEQHYLSIHWDKEVQAARKYLGILALFYQEDWKDILRAGNCLEFGETLEVYSPYASIREAVEQEKLAELRASLCAESDTGRSQGVPQRRNTFIEKWPASGRLSEED